MTAIAAIRPDAWNFPLLLHLMGAMVMVGALVLAASALFLAWRDSDAALVRLGYRSLLIGALPAWLVMRAGGEWIASKEGWTAEGVPTPTWLGIGFVLADAGGLILLISLIAGGVGVRRLRAGQGSALLRSTLVLSVVLLGAYVVAVWAMSGKPS